MTPLEQAAVAVTESRDAERPLVARLQLYWCTRREEWGSVMGQWGPNSSCVNAERVIGDERARYGYPEDLCDACKKAKPLLEELQRLRRRRGGLCAHMYRLARAAKGG
jgi:hypothetical protein